MSEKPLFRSAFDAGNWTPEEVLAFHRARHADFRMEGEDDPPADDKKSAGDTGFTDPDTGEKYGFPANTPTAQMTAEQKAEYWRHKSRKHEARADAHKDYDQIKTELDELKAQHQTDAEKAVEQAKKDAAEAARRDVAAEFAPKLVQAKLEAALAASKVPADKIKSHVEFLDHTKFLTDAGEVDTDKVTQYAAGLAPAGDQWPDTGQGNRGKGDAADKGVAAGAEMFAASRGKKSA